MNVLSPFEGGKYRITSIIGYRTHPVTKVKYSPHYGLDIVGESSKRITCIASGVVAKSTIITNKSDATWQWGNYVRVDGDDGYYYYYCHMSQRIATVGQRVKIGDVLGIEGATGQTTGSHLHLEKRKGLTKCTLPALIADPLNVASHLGIPNAVGTYTAATQDKPTPQATSTSSIKVGNRVKVRSSAIDAKTRRAPLYGGTGAFVAYYDTYDVLGVSGTRVVIGKDKIVTAAVDASILEKI